MAWSSLNSIWKIIKYRIDNPKHGYKEIGDEFGLTPKYVSRLIRENYQDVWDAKKGEGVVSGNAPPLESFGPDTGRKAEITGPQLNKILDLGMKDPNRKLSKDEYDQIKSMNRTDKANRIYKWHEKGVYKEQKAKGFSPEYIRDEFGGANKDIYDKYRSGDITLERLRDLSRSRRYVREGIVAEGRDVVPKYETNIPLADKMEYIKNRFPDYPFEDRTEAQIFNKYHVLKSGPLTDYGKYQNKDWDEVLKSPEEIEKAAINLGRSSFRAALTRVGPQAYPLLGNTGAQRHLLNEFIDAKRVFLNKLARGERIAPYDMGHITSHEMGGLFYGPNMIRQEQFENRSGGSQNLLSASDIEVDLQRADTFLDILNKNRIGDVASKDKATVSNPNIFSQYQKPDVQYIDITPEQSAIYDDLIRNAPQSDKLLLLPDHPDARYVENVVKSKSEGGPDQRKKQVKNLKTRIGARPAGALQQSYTTMIGGGPYKKKSIGERLRDILE